MSPRVGEFYSYDRAYNLGIVVANVWHAMISPASGDIVPGHLLDVTFEPGRICATVASEADDGGQLRVCCATSHGLAENDLVMLEGMNVTAHDAPSRISVVNGTEFICDDVSYSSGAGPSSGMVKMPAYLQAGQYADGLYAALFKINATGTSAAKLAEFIIAVEATPAANTLCRRSTTGTTGELNCHGVLSLVAGDRVWVMAANRTNANDIVVHNCNLSLHRIGF